MSELVPCLLLLCVLGVCGQSYPRFQHNSDTYLNNSFIDRSIIGQDETALQCVTDHTPCCNVSDGGWSDPQGAAVQTGIMGATDVYVTRSASGQINLNRITAGASGMWRCDIPDSSGVMQRIYIYLGNDTTGILDSAAVSFTSLLSEVNEERPQFTLTCRSQGGPATSVSWQRGSTVIEEDTDHVTSLILVDTSENTVYDNTLRVTGREPGQYQCTVSNNRVDFFGVTGSTFTSDLFEVQVAGEPTRVSVIQSSQTSIEVTWKSPGPPVTGYRIFFSPDVGVIEVAGGDTESYMREGLQSGVDYSISIVGLSPHLPSTVVGPITPSVLDPPTVSISATGSPTVGSTYNLMCQVTVPGDVTLSEDPITVEFEGPDGVAVPVTATLSGTTNVYTASLPVTLTLSSRGDYFCFATYTAIVMGDNAVSPLGSDSHTADVMIAGPRITVEIGDMEVPYIGNNIALACVVTLSGVRAETEVDVVLSWMKDGNSLTVSDRITITAAMSAAFRFLVTGSVNFMPLEESDGGEYTCQAVISPLEGDVPSLTASEGYSLTLITPSVTVATEPSSLRILDVSGYNDFSVTCSASADADGTAVPLEEIVWERRVGSTSFQAVSTSHYTVTGSADSGYESVLMRTETDTSATIQFRCTASLTAGGSVQGTSTTSLTVSGPMPPAALGSVRAGDLTAEQAIIRWTVLSIAYTPETYRVLYGTVEDTLDKSSGVEMGGTNIAAVDTPFSVTLSNLQPVTTYYYKVVANNTIGSTESSVETFTTLSRTTSPPTSFTSVPMDDPLIYTFSWGLPVNLFNSRILSYTVLCSPSLAGVEGVDSTTSDNRTTTATLTLGYGLTYTCCVLASNDAGPSEGNCLDMDITTPQREPTGPPQDFNIIAGSTNLTFSWNLPLPPDRNGPIISYTIQCSGLPPLSPPLSSPYTATGFTPYTNYTCSISASTAGGEGPAAELTIRTLEAVPDAPPQDFTHSVMDGVRNVTFHWTPPPEASTNGLITHYSLTCNSSLVETTSGVTLEVTSFSPGTWYSCTISASTSVGEGPQSAPITVLTVPASPEGLNVSEVDTETVVGLQVTWSAVSSAGMYRVEVERRDRGDNRTFTTTTTDFTITSQAVGGYERVKVQVVAVNGAGSGPASDPQTSRTPSIAPGSVGPVMVSEGDVEVTVSWSRPLSPNGVLTGYMVSVEEFEGGAAAIGPVEVANDTLSTVINITTLVDGVPYHVVVVAVNEKGSGLADPLLYFVRELPASVVVLEGGQPLRSDNGDIVLSWKKPNSVQARGNLTGYQIDFVEVGGEGARRRRQDDCPQSECVLEAGQTRGCCLVDANQTSATISGLDSSKAYNVSIRAVNGAGLGEPQIFTVEGTSSGPAFPIVIVAAAAGGGALVLVLIVAILSVIVILLRRSRVRGYKAYPHSPSPSMDTKPARLDAAKKKGEELSTFAAVNVQRSPEEMERMRPIELDQFTEHVIQMHQDRDKGFELEYQCLSTDPVAPNEAAKRNKNKNRFANIFPYDHNRVRLLEMDGVEGSDYINASFIDGYSRSNTYIAAQGPMGGTILDFWRMIWEHKPTTIVMLTKQVEGGKRKCEVYWPEKVGGTFNAGAGIHVYYKELIPFADYEIKIFSVTHAGKPNVPALEVKHFQFLGWPDHGVPKFATSLISFIRRLREHHNTHSAMLVHCSAGVGRTGAFILLDSMLERMMSEKTVNVYEFLTHMREQRVHMVQTLAQYVFIHDALEELITCGDTSISSSNLRTYIRKMHKIIPEKAISGFTDQFRLLKKVSRLPIDSDLSDALEPYNKEKNRYPSRVPYNMNRARLRPTGVSGAEYINASFLDGYKQRNAYIATQAPLRNTVNDFWRMMWEFKSRAIVMLCQLTENEQEASYQYWPTQQGAKQMCGKNSVTLVSEEEMSEAPEVKVRKFEITDDKNTSTFTITQYQVTTWPEQGRVSPQLLIKLITHLTKLQRSTENKPITVMCNDGMGRTGTFVCIHAMLERMNTEGVVDFFQFIKFSRISRPDIVREQEHYILCHDTLADYLDSFDTYANFKA